MNAPARIPIGMAYHPTRRAGLRKATTTGRYKKRVALLSRSCTVTARATARRLRSTGSFPAIRRSNDFRSALFRAFRISPPCRRYPPRLPLVRLSLGPSVAQAKWTRYSLDCFRTRRPSLMRGVLSPTGGSTLCRRPSGTRSAPLRTCYGPVMPNTAIATTTAARTAATTTERWEIRRTAKQTTPGTMTPARAPAMSDAV